MPTRALGLVLNLVEGGVWVNKLERLRSDILSIARFAVQSALPEPAVERALKSLGLSDAQGRIVVVSVGKAAWRMAASASNVLGDLISHGIVITKYGHSNGPLDRFEIFEAGHPIPDENTLAATRRALEITSELSERDTVLFLVSGGGSSLFEVPLEGVELSELKSITDHLLKSGANIVELNTVRKHLSAVKGGRFAQHVAPAKVVSLVLSDVIGDRLDTIASGPAHPDSSTSEEAMEIIAKYHVPVSDVALAALRKETPKALTNVESHIIGSLKLACEAAVQRAQELGYSTMLLTTYLTCEAKEAGRFLASVAREILESDRPVKKEAIVIAGGETVVRVIGKGVGGRNQELALSFAIEVDGLDGVALCSMGTDGTDGPTDAAGGLVDGFTCERLRRAGLSPRLLLEDNDSYNALKASGDLIITGPTGTNVNDIVVLGVL